MEFDVSPVPLKEKIDYLAPDGSEIRLLINGLNGNLCHCTLPAGSTTVPVRHRNVEELWFVIEGRGQIWREGLAENEVIEALP
ncbi:MAG: hypothetical protein H7070_14285, partial [Saprospiraceae bacterium]|nr:hypothetical protein [Pyrinomonadaceae bacterium]